MIQRTSGYRSDLDLINKVIAGSNLSI